MAYKTGIRNNGTSSTPSVTVPGGIAAGDIVIIGVTGNVQADTPTPTGFTQFGSSGTLTVNSETSSLWWKRATGPDSGTYAFTGGSWGAGTLWIVLVAVFSGRDPDESPENTLNINDVAVASPATTIATGVTALNGDDLLHYAVTASSGIATGFDGPLFWIAEQGFSGTGGHAAAFCVKQNVAAGPTGDITDVGYANTTMAWQTWLVRIPAPVVQLSLVGYTRRAGG